MSDVIVVGADGSPTALAAVEWAADDAARTRVPLRIVYAVERQPYQLSRFSDTALDDALDQEAAEVLAAAEAAARDRHAGLAISVEAVDGGAADVLREQAAKFGEVVVGSRGLGGFAGLVVGSVSMRVAGHAPGPVVVVRNRPEWVRGEIVVGVDDSPECRPALAYAFEQAWARESALRAVHTWQLPVYAYAANAAYELDQINADHRIVATELVDSFRGRYPGVRVTIDVHCEHPVVALIDASAEADLLVVGSHGRSGLGSAVLGSVSRSVLHHAHCPVAVVRPRM
ncbi:universal stress protein [Acrocarpospora corrugata]|uniref:Universal stress protein n=1 Tax=Acrocarpospora corrugata TaxID=35763 RepID=A0A5M3VWB7_9ACTN|nr:universal stress protein [Acrocarpospora corrugata]GER99392.1 universal stress protein [Acrocarpospora corrugata]